MNTYQKQKQKIQSLQDDIYKLVMEPDSIEAQAIRTQYAIHFQTQKQQMLGVVKSISAYQSEQPSYKGMVRYL